MSTTSDPEEPEVEEDELQAAAQHLTQDFLCQVIQEEEGRGKKTDDREQEAGPDMEGVETQRQAAPLAAILGKLPSAASLGLQQTFEESETGEKPDGKNGNTNLTDGLQVMYILMVCFCFWCVYR